MRLERLSIALRQRGPWEAMDLGLALWRQHLGAILRPWLGLTLPVFVLLNALAWSMDVLWLAALLMWWLKPWFDRVPLYVLSRAVFGVVPNAWQVLRAREVYTPGLFAWLSWRRLHPVRALLLPVDLLEGVTGTRRGLRGAVLQRAVGAQAFGLMFAGLCFELAVITSLLTVGLMFMPTEWLSESARAVWSTLFLAPPKWALLLLNALHWLAVTLVEPMYVGAGFGLYLNRRTQLEAWDVELVFRRLAARAQAAAATLGGFAAIAMLCASLLAPISAQAKPVQPAPITPAQLVGDAARPPDPKFDRALDRAFADPSLAKTRKISRWALRTPSFDTKKPSSEASLPAWLGAISWVLAAMTEYGLWVLAALLVLFLLWKLPRWLPWMKQQMRTEPPLPESIEQVLPEAQPLPDDVPAAVAALWRENRQRDALALFYRASVARLSDRLGTAFPPGTTEADSLRRARRLDDADARATFGEVVRTWQRAAYAHQFPDGESFATLLAQWSLRFPVTA